MSKIIERVVATRLVKHMMVNNLKEHLQSAYCKFHSTETALLKVQNDILCALDDNKNVFLVLLDLSAAFDTVNHSTLLNRLSSRIGLSGIALQWFESYLLGRKQCVCIGGVNSKFHDLDCGVPQGSVLGPILFTIYTAPLGDLVRKHNFDYHLYADDTQLYVAFKRNCPDANAALTSLEGCIEAVRQWMAHNFLKLNDDKTEFLVIKSKHHRPSPLDRISSIHIGDCDIKKSEKARNIGATFDDTLSHSIFVDEKCRSAYFHIRNISKIRKFLTPVSCSRLVHAFVTSKLDHLNSLLLGMPNNQLKKLQHLQNIAARIITRSRRSVHITPILKQLHWLPIYYRIEFKVLLYVYKSFNGYAPGYITDLLKHYSPSRLLRSENKLLLSVPRSKTKTYGDRSFSMVAPRLWNALPLSLRSSPSIDTFKKHLKAYLFSIAYEP